MGLGGPPRSLKKGMSFGKTTLLREAEFMEPILEMLGTSLDDDDDYYDYDDMNFTNSSQYYGCSQNS